MEQTRKSAAASCACSRLSTLIMIVVFELEFHYQLHKRFNLPILHPVNTILILLMALFIKTIMKGHCKKGQDDDHVLTAAAA